MCRPANCLLAIPVVTAIAAATVSACARTSPMMLGITERRKACR